LLHDEEPVASVTGMPDDRITGEGGDFTWQGTAHQSYSFWYNNRNIIAARLFGEYVDGLVPMKALVSEWVPTGTAIHTHWDVLSQYDTKHPLKDWAPGSVPIPIP